ncbi:tripartite tricarboxylate transporter substrate-binding protein [Variovorax sp. JS1663]|uniref:tripartite tricarboxylate transporter substrate-binding protein n=1 Tax=Variovorax sp. JS1663 TaxID=1851577 RepID=UPI000B341D77|nr:tripartite tricarboxylate transporter substrate-binding protein [Variovorax sp. JS1663]OUM03951.1 hypothetical protein A8M77_02745 [Variovorax sp. JS1663]
MPFAPARTPQRALDTIAADAVRIVRLPAVRTELAAQGIEATGQAQREFQKQVETEYARYERIVKVAGIKAD